MKKTLLLLIASFCTLTQAQIERPKLIVGIVVDQMRPDYLYRYYNDYGEGGFKRLMKDGFLFRNTHYNYMPTYTAPGHASVYTGAIPAVHGIVGNSWFHRREGVSVYCTADTDVQGTGIGVGERDGMQSPRRLKTTTITDELKLETNMRSKVIALSIKDRGAVLPAGHFGDAAYWMDKYGNFISSSYFLKELPAWVANYNAQKNAQKYINQGWSLSRPIETYDESLADDNPYEKVFEPMTKPVFPYDLKGIAAKQGNLEIIKTTPYGNDMLTELGIAAIKNERLGKGEFTDFLAISYSSPDYAGHNWSPRSIEIQDMYLRLDQNFATLLNTLDAEVGKGNYLVFITADHAAAENPNYLREMGYNVRNLERNEVAGEVKQLLQQTFGQDLFLNYSNQNIYLNEELIREKNIDYDNVVHTIRKHLESKPYVARVYTEDEILRGNSTDYHLTLIKRGYDPRQNGQIVVLLDPQYMEYSHVGTTHGSTYMYDSHVPNIWYGWNVPAGQSPKKYHITDIAPTISMMLNIKIPNGSEASILEELVVDQK
ncbi:MAG: alkaline phosphatase family protein [Weeksellaceae bacterium]|nr:alkaline phosphatase family protein [Weeksellaceae bacterium]